MSDGADPRVLVLQELRKQTSLLSSIDATLTSLASVTANMLEAWRKVGPTADSPINDRLCNGPHGDPIVRQKDPRDWTSDSMMGKRFSECPPEYLDLLAERLDYFASKKDASDPEEARKQKFELLDASRARAWAQRKRNGWTAPAQEPVAEGEPRW